MTGAAKNRASGERSNRGGRGGRGGSQAGSQSTSTEPSQASGTEPSQAMPQYDGGSDSFQVSDRNPNAGEMVVDTKRLDLGVSAWTSFDTVSG